MAVKPFNICVKNNIPMSRIREKTQVGLEPKYQKSFEATEQQDDTRYAKNHSRAFGLCKGCEHYDKSKKDTTTGEHCKLRRCCK